VSSADGHGYRQLRNKDRRTKVAGAENLEIKPLETEPRRCNESANRIVNVDAAAEGAASFRAAASSLCQALKTRCFVIGNTVSRLPIALKIALPMAGAIGPIVGSPAPHPGTLSAACVSYSG
jgi:hypothetical protein